MRPAELPFYTQPTAAYDAVYAASGELVCFMTNSATSAARNDFIMRACNFHDAQAVALSKAESIITVLLSHMREGDKARAFADLAARGHDIGRDVQSVIAEVGAPEHKDVLWHRELTQALFDLVNVAELNQDDIENETRVVVLRSQELLASQDLDRGTRIRLKREEARGQTLILLGEVDSFIAGFVDDESQDGLPEELIAGIADVVKIQQQL